MHQIFKTSFDSNKFDIILLITRVLIASFMIVHAVPKFNLLFVEGDIQFADPIGIGMGPSLFLAVFSELICSIFILIGLGTRVAVIPLIATMLVAAFVIHLNDPFSKQELSLHYLVTYVMLFVTGSGKYSVDHILSKMSGK
jgi:putative oxidoreductase